MSKLKTMRDAAKLSRLELAEMSGVNARTIEGYEQGKKDINGAKLKTLLKLCHVLNCSLNDILDDQELLDLIRQSHDLNGNEKSQDE